MNKNTFAVEYMRDTDLLAMPLIADFFELILTDRNTADPLDVVAIRQFDGMADMLAIEGDRSICSLIPVFPHELEGVPSFHRITAGSLEQRSTHCTYRWIKGSIRR
ncbi:hypothetical protein D3C71_1429690 [compost metagenome]